MSRFAINERYSKLQDKVASMKSDSNEKRKDYFSTLSSNDDNIQSEVLLEKLRIEINKGWSGSASTRDIKKIISDKTKFC